MQTPSYKFRSKVWLYPGAAAWHFISLPKTTARTIKKLHAAEARGWGSLPVVVTIGSTTWKTSIFPDNKTGTYLLPLKAKVRKVERIVAGGTVTIEIQIQL